MNSFFVYQLFLIVFVLHATTTIATTSLFPGQSLSGNQTLTSPKAEFRLGFFSPQNTSTKNSYYIGIWFNKMQNQVLWVANRDTPVLDPNTSQLTISQDGKLVLLDQSQTTIWSSNITQKLRTNRSLIATLLDTGNLVLTDSSNSSDVVWQSFDYPADTLMAGEWFGVNPVTGAGQSLTSWKNLQDPATGIYSFELYPPGAGSSGQYVLIWNQSKVYYYFENGFVSSIVDMPFNVNYSYEYNGHQFRYTVDEGGPKYTRSIMGVNGQIQAQAWFDSSKRWIVEWPIPNLCDVYSACGVFGICDQTSANQYCTCLPGFEPDSPSYWDVVNSWNGGSCVRKSSLRCDSTSSSTKENQDGFLMVSSIKLPTDSYELLQVQSHKHCESACFNNCSCSAYAYRDSQCRIFIGGIRNLKRVSGSSPDASVLFLRLAKTDLPRKISSNKAYKIAVLATIVAIVFILVCACLVVLLRRRIYQNSVTTNGYLNQFSYTFLVDCTKRFSQKLGKGSFGSVFKGQLPDSTTIAVKRLEGSRQGEKQFRTEVKTLGQIQHVNLVRLHGFSLKGEERLLVYAFMPNSSLDTHLFNDGAKTLSWNIRFPIIQGVARGLAYLHEECRERIIHCDIKPENILLDATFSPKIADFGLAKLIGRDLGEVLTTTRGTLGYLAPEWISGLPITAKADVYSFGMMLFEIISGRRNRKTTKNGYFPVWAVRSISSGEVQSLVDEKLEGEANLEEVARVLCAASWCIQDYEMHRPTMTEVLRILDGSLSIGVAPVPRSLEEVACDEEMSFYLE
ncbi:Serine/threonine-protein kinase [Rhynchospora pubera]|uniref:Receptor-like serine/threonine-protein kinase n=1 Tax=Rhynchospora pubera TaxID=906938 RepID=A0AAV8DC18_9POAL|nr:Serine/threonine-protein kinase [Rhynchospora pubera]